MISWNDILPILKYAGAICVFVCIFFAPAYLAAANNRSKYDCMRTRMGSWMFGWTIIGWIFALFVSAKK